MRSASGLSPKSTRTSKIADDEADPLNREIGRGSVCAHLLIQLLFYSAFDDFVFCVSGISSELQYMTGFVSQGFHPG